MNKARFLFSPKILAETAKTLEFPNKEELQGEYVSGGYSGNVRLSLDSYDTQRPGLTVEMRRSMRYDSEIESSVEFLVDAVFSEGVSPVPRISDSENPEFEKANEINDFIRRATNRPGMARRLETVLREVFRDAFYAGVKTAEIVLCADENSSLILDRLNPKPNSAITFVCDRFYNVLGLTSWNRFYSSEEIAAKKDDIIPREKFLIMQLELEDNHPSGIAKIRAAFDDYADKKNDRAVYKEWKRTSAIPKKYGITGPNAKDTQVRNPDGSQAVENGIPKTITAEKGLMMALEGYANNSTVTAPNGTTIGQLEVQGTGDQFIKSLKFNNGGIRKAILGDSVTTGDDDKGIKAAKEVANDVVDLKVRTMKSAVSEAVERDVYLLLTVVNFGVEFAHLSPVCSLGDTERRDWATDLGAAAGAGYTFANEHLAELDPVFGLKPRKELSKVETEPTANDDEETETE
jgi:hypothetical protein